MLLEGIFMYMFCELDSIDIDGSGSATLFIIRHSNVYFIEIIYQLKQKKIRVGVTASTGTAACNIGGLTLHRY